MTRIVAGAMGGRRIEVPRSGTRPTSERVREALFARLDHYGVLDGARVLDLCAGSGALGLEAASRGAGDVTLVDSSRTATDTCRRNIRALGLGGVSAVTAKAAAFLAGPAGAPADLVLIDPPYELSEEELTAILTALVRSEDPWLAPRAVDVVERSTRSPSAVPRSSPTSRSRRSRARSGTPATVSTPRPRRAERRGHRGRGLPAG